VARWRNRPGLACGEAPHMVRCHGLGFQVLDPGRKHGRIFGIGRQFACRAKGRGHAGIGNRARNGRRSPHQGKGGLGNQSSFHRPIEVDGDVRADRHMAGVLGRESGDHDGRGVLVVASSVVKLQAHK